MSNVCPMCKRDLTDAVRLLGEESFVLHLQLHVTRAAEQVLDLACRAANGWAREFDAEAVMVARPFQLERAVAEYMRVVRLYRLARPDDRWVDPPVDD